MSYPDFPPSQPDPYDDRRSGRPSSSRSGRSPDDRGRGYDDRDRGHRRGDGGDGYSARGRDSSGGRARDGWGRGGDSRDDRRSGSGGGRGGDPRGGRASGWGSSRGGSGRDSYGERRGDSRGGGSGWRDSRGSSRGGDGRHGGWGGGREDGYGRDSGRGDNGRRGGGRGWESSRSWPGSRDGAGSGGRGRGHGEEAGRGGRGGSWGDRPGAGSRGWSRGGESAEHWSGGREPGGRGSGAEQWARRGATALRERYRDATDWFSAQQGGPRGFAARIPLLSRFAGEGGGRGGRGGGWDGRGPRPRRKGDWWRRWTWKKAAAVLGVAFGVMAVAGAAVISYLYSTIQIPAVPAASLQQASTVYYSNGQPVGQFALMNRTNLTSYNQIPKVVIDSFLAAEDNNFFHEGGISPTGILRAAYDDVMHPGGGVQGGSTLTQELVRNYYDLGFQQTFSRKIKEMFIAEKVAQKYSKQWVMLKFINTVNFGNDGSAVNSDSYGIAAAAQLYFHIPISRLSTMTPAQAALLTAIPNDPTYFSAAMATKSGPAYQALYSRWQYVLQRMQTDGYLTAQQLAQQKFPKVYPAENNGWGPQSGYIMQAVLNELETTYHYSKQRIYSDGLSITTTFNKKLTASLYATVKTEIRDMKTNAQPYPLTLQSASGTSIGWPKYANMGVVLENPHNGAIEAMYSGPNYDKSNYDMALQARNEVGSSFKPYVLSAAVAEGMNTQTSILNGGAPAGPGCPFGCPVWVPPVSEPLVHASYKKQPSPWYGPIYNDESSAPPSQVSVKDATAASLNTAFTDLYHRVARPDGMNGVNEITKIAQLYGVNVGPWPNGSGLTGPNAFQDLVGTALGMPALTVEEQATMMATLADNGLYHAPHVIAKIQNGNQVTVAHPAHHQVLTSQQAAQVFSVMEYDTQIGLGTAPGMGMSNGQVIIAKTGTTNLSQQAFFLGATPYAAMAVGQFVNDSNCPTGYKAQCQSQQSLNYNPNIPGLQTLFGTGGYAGYGGQWPAYLWYLYFNKEFDNRPVVQWPAASMTYGSKWVLVNPPKPKPKPKPKPSPSCQPGGNGNGHGHGQPCPSQSAPPPPPTASPSPTICVPLPGQPCPSSSPAPSPSVTAGPAAATTRASVTGTAVAGTVLFGGVIAVAEPARRRRRGRRRP